jgi:hypothetical protein
VAFPAQNSSHCAAEHVMAIMESSHTYIGDACGRLRGTLEVVGGHHVDENPRHAKVQLFSTEKRFERPPSAPHAECSGWRLYRDDSCKGRLVVKPLSQWLDPGQVFNGVHAASLVAQARHATAHSRAATIASLQHFSLGHLAQKSAKASQLVA